MTPTFTSASYHVFQPISMQLLNPPIPNKSVTHTHTHTHTHTQLHPESLITFLQDIIPRHILVVDGLLNELQGLAISVRLLLNCMKTENGSCDF